MPRTLLASSCPVCKDRRQPGQEQNAVGRLGLLTPALCSFSLSPQARTSQGSPSRRGKSGPHQGGVPMQPPPRAPGQDLGTGGAAAPPAPLRRAPPSSSCGTRAGAPRSDAPSSRCPSAAAAAAAQSATWTPPAPERAAADRPPGKVTGALAAGASLTGSLLSVSQPSLPPCSWAPLPGSPLSSPWVFSPAPGFPGSFWIPRSSDHPRGFPQGCPAFRALSNARC